MITPIPSRSNHQLECFALQKREEGVEKIELESRAALLSQSNEPSAKKEVSESPVPLTEEQCRSYEQITIQCADSTRESTCAKRCNKVAPKAMYGGAVGGVLVGLGVSMFFGPQVFLYSIACTIPLGTLYGAIAYLKSPKKFG